MNSRSIPVGVTYSRSLFQAKQNELTDAFLADVCIGTSAAPTYLPAHYFQTKDSSGNTKSFNLIDGGVAANNPVYIFSISEWCNYDLNFFLIS
jgi:patatin-like phospholipase/acyl hydrolase